MSSRKFYDEPEKTPGPGAYKLPQLRQQKAQEFSKILGQFDNTGTSFTFQNEEKIRDKERLGPGSYSCSKFCTKQAPILSIPQLTRYQYKNDCWCESLSRYSADQAPGPQSYQRKMKKINVRTFVSNLNRGLTHHSEAEKVMMQKPTEGPEVGTYNVNFKVLDEYKPTYSICKADRLMGAKDQNSPGPGAYDVENITRKGPNKIAGGEMYRQRRWRAFVKE